jgi:hypothetical protein
MTPATEVPEGAIVRCGFGIVDLLMFPARYDEAPALPRRAGVIHRECQFQILRLWAGFGIVGYLPLELHRADEDDHDAIVGLIDAAAQWLRAAKDTDQWTLSGSASRRSTCAAWLSAVTMPGGGLGRHSWTGRA